jgi:hypothetical protein
MPRAYHQVHKHLLDAFPAGPVSLNYHALERARPAMVGRVGCPRADRADVSMGGPVRRLNEPVDDDNVAEVLRSLRVHSTIYCRSRLRAPWGFGVRSRGVSAFHVVAAGQCWLEVDGVDEPVRLTAGDLVVLMTGRGHRVRDNPGSEASGARRCRSPTRASMTCASTTTTSSCPWYVTGRFSSSQAWMRKASEHAGSSRLLSKPSTRERSGSQSSGPEQRSNAPPARTRCVAEPVRWPCCGARRTRRPGLERSQQATARPR